jgi:3-dehydroquinate dehydratase-2
MKNFRVLVIHGAGIELRGKVDIPTFGTATMEDYDRAIASFSNELGIEVETFHSLVAGDVIAELKKCTEKNIRGIIINPASFTKGNRDIGTALENTGLPVVEVHISNPARRGTVSEIAPSVRACVAGFGIRGYHHALQGLLDMAK